MLSFLGLLDILSQNLDSSETFMDLEKKIAWGSSKQMIHTVCNGTIPLIQSTFLHWWRLEISEMVYLV